MKYYIMAGLISIASLSFADDTDAISSAYQFRSCYEFEFNKQLLSNDVEYNVINDTGHSVKSGVINSNNSSFIFCEHNVFNNYTTSKYDRLMKHPFTYFVNGVDLDERAKKSEFSIILKNRTQDKIQEFNKVDFGIDHNFDLIPDNLGTKLETAMHKLKFNIDTPLDVLINNTETPKSSSTFSSNFRLLSPSAIKDDKYKIVTDGSTGTLLNQFIPPNGWGMLSCIGASCEGEIGFENYDMAFMPRAFSVVEHYTFYVSFDSNPNFLPDLTIGANHNSSREITFDYKDIKDQNITKTYIEAGGSITFDYEAPSYEKDFSLFVDNPEDLTQYPYCGAFDYDHATGIISGYCNFDGTVMGKLTNVSANMKNCSSRKIEIYDNKIRCADDRIKTNPYAALPRSSTTRTCPSSGTDMQYILSGVANQNNIPNALCRHLPNGYNPGTVEYISNEAYVNNHTGDDWAPNWAKRECPAGKVAVGITTVNASSTLICATPRTPISTSNKCFTKWFNQYDNGYIEHPDIGDWAKSSYKGEVELGHYIAGVAAYRSDTSLSSYSVILECEM